MKKRGKTLIVLVVDDDLESVENDRRTLETEYAVLTAACGEEALRIARDAEPAVIVLDVMMAGGKDGFAVFRELSYDPATRTIPIIFQTAVNQAMGVSFGVKDVGRYLGREPAAVLEKPVAPDTLLKTVSRVSARHALRKRGNERDVS